jgi:hypothetical protein
MLAQDESHSIDLSSARDYLVALVDAKSTNDKAVLETTKLLRPR